MNCHALDRWLDDGGPEAGRAEAIDHARTCARCASALAQADALERALAAAPPVAPTGFAERVMARVAEASQVRKPVPVMELLPLVQTFPWWVRLALEPASVLAAMLASVLVWRGDALFALARVGAGQLAAWVASSLVPAAPIATAASEPGPLATLLLQPTILTCLVIGAVPMAWMMSQVLFGWTASIVGPHHTHSRAR